MVTENYRYWVMSESNANYLSDRINASSKNGWELVPGQSVTVTACPYYQDGEARDTEWSYTVIVRART